MLLPSALERKEIFIFNILKHEEIYKLLNCDKIIQKSQNLNSIPIKYHPTHLKIHDRENKQIFNIFSKHFQFLRSET